MQWSNRNRYGWRVGAGLGWVLVAVLGLGPRLAAAQAAPVAPATSSGTYSVSYTRCTACAYDWLEERVEGGQWASVGQGTVSVTAKPTGTYYYRVAYLYALDPYYLYTSIDYSGETRVTVTANAPPLDPLESQLRYRYETRYGDGNGDGRLDLFVNRIAGGVSGNGALEATLLVQDGTARFSAVVPTATQSTVARSWPAAAVQSVLGDFNADGFADVLLKGVAGALGIGNALNQIVYAPGRVLTQIPLGVRGVDAGLKKFAANARDYLADPSYFSNNAPLTTVWQTAYYYYCWPWGWVDYYTMSCGWVEYYYTVTVRDYSVFEPNALSAWTSERAIEQGLISRTQGLDEIERSFKNVLGAPIGGRVQAGIAAEQGVFDTSSRRGFELFLAVLGIFEANAQELTPPREAGRRPDVVYVTGRRILGWGFLPLHTALEYSGATISAYDNNASFLDDGVLVSQVNWASDQPSSMMTLGTVSSMGSPASYWQQLLGADARYDDNLPYDAVPSAGEAGYNSNGYVHGLVRATGGMPSIDLGKFVGGEKPVPSTAFN